MYSYTQKRAGARRLIRSIPDPRPPWPPYARPRRPGIPAGGVSRLSFPRAGFVLSLSVSLCGEFFFLGDGILDDPTSLSLSLSLSISSAAFPRGVRGRARGPGPGPGPGPSCFFAPPNRARGVLLSGRWHTRRPDFPFPFPFHFHFLRRLSPRRSRTRPFGPRPRPRPVGDAVAGGAAHAVFFRASGSIQIGSAASRSRPNSA